MNPKDPYGVPMGVVPRLAKRGMTTIETLHWHSAASVPDADLTALMWVKYRDGEEDGAAGWWDGDAWRYIVNGGRVSSGSGTVLYWAEPAGLADQAESSSTGPGNVKHPEPALPTMGEQLVAVIADIWAEHPGYSIRQTLDALNSMFPAPQPEPCVWAQADSDTDLWETSCGWSFRLDEGAPAENRMKWCCYCGKPLEEHPWVDEEDVA